MKILVIAKLNDATDVWTAVKQGEMNYSSFVTDMAERMLLDRELSYVQWESREILYRVIRDLDKTKFNIIY